MNDREKLIALCNGLEIKDIDHLLGEQDVTGFYLLGEVIANRSKKQRQQSLELLGMVEALKKRLEINPAAPEYDGISCRDETIKALEKQVAELKLALESDYR